MKNILFHEKENKKYIAQEAEDGKVNIERRTEFEEKVEGVKCLDVPEEFITKLAKRIKVKNRTERDSVRDISDEEAFEEAIEWLENTDKDTIYNSDLFHKLRIPYDQVQRVMNKLDNEGYLEKEDAHIVHT